MDKQWIYLGSGRNRHAFRHGNYVIKVPVNSNGIADNYHERYVFEEYRKDQNPYIHYARCRLFNEILVMQFAQFQGSLSDETGYICWGNAPRWCSYVDCCQVGYNRFGKIVAYDYGLT